MHLKAFPGVVRQFWDHIWDGMSPADAGMAVGVSLHTGRKWFAHAGGVRPKFPDDGPRKRPRLTQEERIEIDAGVKAEKSAGVSRGLLCLLANGSDQAALVTR